MHPDPGGQSIPARVVIGVIGRPGLEVHPSLIQGTRSAIEKIEQIIPSLRRTPVALTILSSLAEEADRLVAREILKVPGAMLEIVLPCEKEQYVKAFETGESREAFADLLSQARIVKQVPLGGNRTEAYKRVQRYIVDQCDVLIAVWDGELGSDPDGVAETVQYARGVGCPLIWIHTDDSGLVTLEFGRGLNLRQFQDLDEYNSETVDTARFTKRLRESNDFFMSATKRARLPWEELQPILKHMLPHHVRCDLLASRYKDLHYRTESLVYALALAAIAIAAFQALFLPNYPIVLVAEVALMLGVLGIVGISRSQQWHTRWIDYRFLAERFHSALFMAAANIDVATSHPPRHLSLSYSPSDWMVSAFSSVWDQRPQPPEGRFYNLEGFREFVSEAWIENQKRYHNAAKKRYSKRHLYMATASYILFGLTICAVLLHILNIGFHLVENILTFAAIVFPATAATVTAIRTQRDYLRNSMRSAEMMRHLEELKNEMMLVDSYDNFRELLKETAETMLRENDDWRVVVRFHTPELPA